MVQYFYSLIFVIFLPHTRKGCFVLLSYFPLGLDLFIYFVFIYFLTYDEGQLGVVEGASDPPGDVEGQLSLEERPEQEVVKEEDHDDQHPPQHRPSLHLSAASRTYYLNFVVCFTTLKM